MLGFLFSVLVKNCARIMVELLTGEVKPTIIKANIRKTTYNTEKY